MLHNIDQIHLKYLWRKPILKGSGHENPFKKLVTNIPLHRYYDFEIMQSTESVLCSLNSSYPKIFEFPNSLGFLLPLTLHIAPETIHHYLPTSYLLSCLSPSGSLILSPTSLAFTSSFMLPNFLCKSLS